MLISTAAKVGRECKDRIDHQLARPVISPNRETCAVRSAHHKVALHSPLASIDFLVNPRSLQSKVLTSALDHKRAVFHANGLCAIKLQFGLPRIRSRRNLKVILQMSLVPVENQIDSGIHACVSNSGKLRHSRAPLRRIIADEIVAFPGRCSIPTGLALELAPASFISIELTCSTDLSNWPDLFCGCRCTRLSVAPSLPRKRL